MQILDFAAFMGGTNMYKIIACDLDETLLSHDRTIHPRNIAAIRAAVERGVRFVPASGRGYATIQGTLKELGLWNRKNQYIISFNGGAITENAGNRVIFSEGLAFAQADALFRRGITYGLCLHVYTMDQVYVWNINEDEIHFLEGRQKYIDISKEKDLSFLRGQEIMKVLYEHPDYSELEKILPEIKNLTGECEISESSGRYLEFNRKGVSKGRGLAALAKYLGIPMEETMAIGDNVNDLPMIRAAGLGVGVGNVYPPVKSDCGYVCRATCDEGAVGEAIEKFVLVDAK